MDAPLARIVAAVRATLDRCPPELAGDLVTGGIVLTGGGALLRGLDARLQHELGIPVLVADRPLDSVVLGTATVVEHFEQLQKVVVDGHRRWSVARSAAAHPAAADRGDRARRRRAAASSPSISAAAGCATPTAACAARSGALYRGTDAVLGPVGAGSQGVPSAGTNKATIEQLRARERRAARPHRRRCRPTRRTAAQLARLQLAADRPATGCCRPE